MKKKHIQPKKSTDQKGPRRKKAKKKKARWRWLRRLMKILTSQWFIPAVVFVWSAAAHRKERK